MRITKADTPHMDAIVQMSVRAFATDASVGGAADDGLPDYDSFAWHKKIADEGHLYQAMIGDELVGAAVVFEDKHNCRLYIGRIFIDSIYHRKGYGMLLMRCIEKHFSYVKQINLDTPEWNVRTNAFYQKLGYTRIGTKDGFVFYQKKKV